MKKKDKNIIIVYGRCPSKKNSRINTRSGRSFPSSKYTAWHKDASKQIFGAEKQTEKGFELTFFLPDNRRCDLTNKAESIMDLLVDNGVIEDDCWQITGDIKLSSGGIDIENPRIEVLYN